MNRFIILLSDCKPPTRRDARSVAVSLLLFSSCWATGAGQVTTPATPSPNVDIVAADLRLDSRLNSLVTVSLKSASLEDCLSALGGEHTPPLTVAPAFRLRRITLLAKRTPLRAVMEALAAVAGLTWRRNVSASGYELVQSREDRAREESQIAASARRDESARNARRDAMRRAINHAIESGVPQAPAMRGLLASLDTEQRSALGDLASDDIGVITVGNNSYLHDHLAYATPFASLSPELQTGIMQMMGQRDSAPDAAVNPTNADSSHPMDLSGSQIGLVAIGGSIYLGVVGPDGKDVSFMPFDAVQRSGIPGVDSDDDVPPEVDEAIGRGRLVDLDTMPAALRSRRLKFRSTLDRGALPEVLESIAAQSGIPVASDDYLRSRHTSHAWALTDRDEYSLEEALDQVARTFAHRFVYLGGTLRCETVVPGLDLRAEPPADLVDRLKHRNSRHEPLRLSDYLDLASLSPLQYTLLRTSRIVGLGPDARISVIAPLREVLRLYASLTDEQRAKAESEKGLPLSAMDQRQARAFRRIADTGLPAAPGEGAKYSAAGFYVDLNTNSAGQQEPAHVLEMRVVSPVQPHRLTRYRLPLP